MVHRALGHEDVGRRYVVAMICVLGWLALPCGASASWLAPESVASLGAGTLGGGLHVANDAAGDAAVAFRSSRARRSLGYEAVVVTREAEGGWSRAVHLSSSRANASLPSVVVTATGEVTVAWSELEKSRGWRQIRVLVRSQRSGHWGSPHLLAAIQEKAEEAPTYAPEVLVALNAASIPTVLFTLGRRATDEAVEIDRRLRDGRWPQARIVAHTTYCVGTSLVFDRTGETLLAWTRGNPISPGSLTRVETLSLKPDLQPNGKRAALSPTGRYAYSPEIAVNARGDATIVWGVEGEESQPSNAPLEAAGRARGHPFTRTQGQRLVVRKGAPGGVSVDPSGTATAVFSTNITEVSTRTLAGRWSAPVPLSAAPGAEVVLAQDTGEDLLAAWRTELPAERGKTETPFAIEASIRTSDGTWGKASIISPPHSSGAAVAIIASNRGLAAWENESTHLLEVAQLVP